MSQTYLPIDEQVPLLLRGAEAVYTPDELRKRVEAAVRSNKPLRVKLGLDPTAPDIHLGHTVVLRKMRQFQDCGHKGVLIIGDFTARIGDPSGKSKTRPVLDEAAIKENAETYFRQAGHVLDLQPEKLEIRYNSEWLSKLDLAAILKLMSHMTVQQMLQRDSFANRLKAETPIVMTELMYPLMQAYDSVAIDSDIELGGTDQTFNNLCGRDLMEKHGKRPQMVMVMPILRGLDGTEKMSKSLGNYIGVTFSPHDMFGKLMSISDALMKEYFELLTNLPQDRIAELLDSNRTHPMGAKKELALEVARSFHGENSAKEAKTEWEKIHQKKFRELEAGTQLFADGIAPADTPVINVQTNIVRIGEGNERIYKFEKLDLIVRCGFAASRGEARRLIQQGGIRHNERVLVDSPKELEVKDGDVLQRGKREFRRLKPIGPNE